MGFLQQARKAQDPTRSLVLRQSSFRSCILRYSWLIRQPQESTYRRFANAFGFSDRNQLTEERLMATLSALLRERERFLRRLLDFSRHRILAKAAKRRTTTTQEMEGLYRTDFFVVE